MGRGEEGVKAGREGAKVERKEGERLGKDEAVERDERRGFSAAINGGNGEEEGGHSCHCKISVKPCTEDEEDKPCFFIIFP